MSEIKFQEANTIEVGTHIYIHGRQYKVMQTSINFGSLGDYVQMQLLDLLQNRFTTFKTQTDAQFQVVA